MALSDQHGCYGAGASPGKVTKRRGVVTALLAVALKFIIDSNNKVKNERLEYIRMNPVEAVES